MCTLIVLHRCVPGRPLVVAANRDEFYARPAEGPAIRETGVGKILAPVDLEAGGTWLGLNERGVFAGLTNLRPWTPTDGTETLDPSALANTGQRSRGEVVMSALEACSAAEAARRLERLEVDAYNPFQLVVADAREAWLIVYRDRPGTIALGPGVHVVGNVEDERVEAELVAIHGSPGPAGAGGPGSVPLRRRFRRGCHPGQRGWHRSHRGRLRLLPPRAGRAPLLPAGDDRAEGRLLVFAGVVGYLMALVRWLGFHCPAKVK